MSGYPTSTVAWLVASIAIGFGQGAATASSFTTKTRNEVLSLILHTEHDVIESDYESQVRPNDKGPPENVTCSIYVNSIDSIEESTMDYSVTIYLRQKWKDHRLVFVGNDTEPIHLQSRKGIWLPDLFFFNVKNAWLHDVTQENVMIVIENTGEVFYSQRLTLKLYCKMKLEKFPLDTQMCSVRIESYSYTDEGIQLFWATENAVAGLEHVELPQFKLIQHAATRGHEAYTGIGGSYDKLVVKFELVRDMGYYLLQIYVPSVLIVILSWVSFWISCEATPARVALGMTTVLTIETQSSGIRSSLPKVAYAKAVDVWMATCLVFVFAALIEFALVNYLCVLQKIHIVNKVDEYEEESLLYMYKTATIKRKKEVIKPDNKETLEKREKSSYRKSSTPPPIRYSKDDENGPVNNNMKIGYCNLPFVGKRYTYIDMAYFFDKASRIIFPLTFTIFNVVYWLFYTTSL